MKDYERRATGNTVYYKVAVWNARSFCFQDATKAFKGTYSTEDKARAACVKPGRYRISRRDVNGGRTDGEPFEV